MSLQEFRSLLFLHEHEHQLHIIEELEMKVVVILQKSHPFPELQNPILSKAEKNLLLGEKVRFRAEEVHEKVFLSGPHPPSATVPPSAGGRGLFFG